MLINVFDERDQRLRIAPDDPRSYHADDAPHQSLGGQRRWLMRSAGSSFIDDARELLEDLCGECQPARTRGRDVDQQKPGDVTLLVEEPQQLCEAGTHALRPGSGCFVRVSGARSRHAGPNVRGLHISVTGVKAVDHGKGTESLCIAKSRHDIGAFRLCQNALKQARMQGLLRLSET
jgi:hypothetical protein